MLDDFYNNDEHSGRRVASRFLGNLLSRLGIVTREELEIQKQVLQKTRVKIEQLEQELNGSRREVNN